mgnify:CR=1 FL=1
MGLFPVLKDTGPIEAYFGGYWEVDDELFPVLKDTGPIEAPVSARLLTTEPLRFRC